MNGTVLAVPVSMKPTLVSKMFVTGAVVAGLGLAFGTSASSAEAGEECSVADVDYAVDGTLMIQDTQFGAGNGVHHIGEGKMRLRVERNAEGVEHTVRLMDYDFQNHFTVKASFAAWSTAVETQSRTTVAHGCDGAATGTMDGSQVTWKTPVGGYHSDGHLDCTGNVCGKFGAPPPGTSPLHEAPAAITFNPFHFGADGKSFTMDYTRVSHSDSPKQTGYLSLTGHETNRACHPARVVCQP